jgi:hypothetical protein
VKRLRCLLLAPALAAAFAAAPASEPSSQGEFVQAVEFPYYLYPRQLWERELVWLDTLGIRTVEFSIPWNWHETEPGHFDFTGATSPRRDLAGFIRILRRLGMRAWIRPLAPIRGWTNSGVPAWAARDRRAQRQWSSELEKLLAPQLDRHGGPIAYVEGWLPWTDRETAPPVPPLPITILSANDPAALARSRHAMAAGRGSLLWEEVEDALYPVGWEAAGSPIFREGAVSMNGDERPTVTALRRDAALLERWAALLPPLAALPLTTKLPHGVTAVELRARTPASAAALSVVNSSAQSFSGELRVLDRAKHPIPMPPVNLRAGDSLWLPIEVPLAGALCKECSAFANGEHVVYATAELQSVEFENGILAMEFAAPEPGEMVLQLTRRPSGPYLAGGRPIDFDWDEKTLRARLPIPAGKGAGSRVRVGLAIEPPETSAFFVDAKRLVLGEKNLISTSYSSEELAQRSRLRLPDGYTAKATVKSPLEMDYEIDVPRDALHGSWVNLAIEADGVPLGRSRLQVFRPLSVHLPDAVKLHYGAGDELTVDPALLTLDPKSGRSLDVSLRNNAPRIQNFVVEAECDGWEFLPAKQEISIGAAMERVFSLRAFGTEGGGGNCDGRIRVSGATRMEIPLRIVAVPRGRTATYSMDLDGDGAPEWIVESQQARAVFSQADGGRWLEFVWKDTGIDFLPAQGALHGVGRAEVRPVEGGLEFTIGSVKRTVRMKGASLTISQSTPIPTEGVQDSKRDNVSLTVTRESATQAVYNLAADERK